MLGGCVGGVRWLHGAGSAGGRPWWFGEVGVSVPSACRFRLVTVRGCVRGDWCPGAVPVASKGRVRTAAEGVLYHGAHDHVRRVVLLPV